MSGLVAASTAGNVALEKQSHPERFCPFPRCLWRTAKLDHTLAFADRVAFARGTGLDVQCAWPKVLVRKS